MVLKPKKSLAKKKRENYTRMPRLGPQDSRGSGVVAGGEGGSATPTPTQQGTVFGANNAAAEFRTNVSSQMNLEYAVALDRATGCTMSCPLFARCEALAPSKKSVERQRCGYCSKEFTGGFAKRVVHLLGNREASVAGGGVPNYKGQRPSCPEY